MRVTAYCIWLCGIGFPQGYKKRHYMNEQQREARRQELLKQTLFYKGEESCPETIAQGCLYWDYESLWVRWELEQDEGYLRTVHWFQTEIQKDQPPYPSVPVGLQEIFASRINYWGGGREPVTMEDVRQFCDKYKQTYNELQKK